MARLILHSDLNNFYASVECMKNPALKKIPLAVCGDPNKRHGIILAKNDLAKKCGIQTGEAIWQARQKCPALVAVPANFSEYLKYSKLVKNIYLDYTHLVEPFGLDEAWLEISQFSSNFKYAQSIADDIRERTKSELGLSVSIGVSFNKIFAKLGSDIKKPDATTIITPENYKNIIWPLNSRDLLFVGRATFIKLQKCGINTIGDIAHCQKSFLESILGKNGGQLWTFANGLDVSPVRAFDHESQIKSIGNSITASTDMQNNQDVKQILLILCESVGERLRKSGLKSSAIQISIRDNSLFSFERQAPLQCSTNLTQDIFKSSISLFETNYSWQKPVRSLGVRAINLTSANQNNQVSFFSDEEMHQKRENLESAIDNIREKFGHFSIRRAVTLTAHEQDKTKDINSDNFSPFEQFYTGK